jgi:hypothetical protein
MYTYSNNFENLVFIGPRCTRKKGKNEKSTCKLIVKKIMFRISSSHICILVAGLSAHIYIYKCINKLYMYYMAGLSACVGIQCPRGAFGAAGALRP